MVYPFHLGMFSTLKDVENFGVVQGASGLHTKPPRDARGVEDMGAWQTPHQLPCHHRLATHGTRFRTKILLASDLASIDRKNKSKEKSTGSRIACTNEEHTR